MHGRITLFFTLLISNFVLASSQGPSNPASFSTDNSVGSITWNNTSNTSSSNDSRAITNSLGNGDQSYYLLATNFSFSVPVGATINGIVVDVEKRDGSGSGNIKDNIVKIIKGGTITGADKSVATNWTSADAYSSYGGTTDLWGTAWSAADINASNFGIAFSIKKTGAGNNTGEIDHISITVHYTTTLPVELLYFKGVSFCKYNLIEWSVASQTNNDYFSIFKSDEFKYWSEIARINGDGNSSEIKTYFFRDKNPVPNVTYYKLKQVDFDGSFVYYNPISVHTDIEEEVIAIYPNPGYSVINIDILRKYSKEAEISMISLSGKVIYRKKHELKEGDNSIAINLLYFPEEIYFIEVQLDKKKIIEKVLKRN